MTDWGEVLYLDEFEERFGVSPLDLPDISGTNVDTTTVWSVCSDGEEDFVVSGYRSANVWHRVVAPRRKHSALRRALRHMFKGVT